MSDSVRCVLDAKASLGESPVWAADAGRLYWVDINAPALHRFDPATGLDESWPMPSAIGCVALDADGHAIGALRDGLYRLDLSGAGQHAKLADAPYDPAEERFNDGRCDAAGRFWIGSMHEPRLPKAALYRYEAPNYESGRYDGGAHFANMVGGVTVSNGLAFSPDGSILYHADTPTHRVTAYDCDAGSGALSNPRVFIDLAASQERPDGATVDAAGNYWVALYGSGRVAQFSPAGERLRDILLPAKAPTMPCFGGKDLRTLFITTARQKHTDEELASMPQAGGLFAIDLPVPGLPEPRFKG